MTHNLVRLARALTFIATVASVTVPDVAAQTRTQSAQKAALDRTKQPAAGPRPTAHIPSWTKATLSNGAQLIVTEKHDLPLVSVGVSFVGGRAQFEDPAKVGVGQLTAQMLSEGTTTRTGDQLADAQQLLGTSISTSIGAETGSIGFTALSSKLAPALDLLADMMLNPTFPADALERRRGQTLVALTQAKDQPNTIANNVFAKTLYGEDHPYGRVTTEESVKAITRDDIVAFHRAYFQPGHAIITIAGDVDPATARAAVEKAFASWPAGGTKPTFSYPAPPALKGATIYLVDKPNAAQSVFALGTPGPARDTPDYYSLQVMNTILGTLFQSRLNHLIREVKGYSYGVGSNFLFGRGPGAFRAGGDIVTAKTDSALIDFMNELRGVQGAKPFTEDEIEQGKESLIQGLVRRFESVGATGASISGIYVQDLPDSYFQDYARNVNAVTAEDLTRVAKKYIDLDHLNMIIVGDRATIEEPLRKTGIAPIVVLDINGKPVPATP
ncbi:MAG TPA: pitrilysin family protein [Gemmatimonadaceae bacterium]|nr:pitrilysin family protein [Gemmatimonadaceae bacterium]